jgi:hypothetical protein
MSRRAIRKVRHRPDAPKVFSFKQRVQMGQITRKIKNKEITLEQIQNDPKIAWMIDVWREIKREAEIQVEEMAPLPSEVPAPAQEGP